MSDKRIKFPLQSGLTGRAYRLGTPDANVGRVLETRGPGNHLVQFAVIKDAQGADVVVSRTPNIAKHFDWRMLPAPLTFNGQLAPELLRMMAEGAVRTAEYVITVKCENQDGFAKSLGLFLASLAEEGCEAIYRKL